MEIKNEEEKKILIEALQQILCVDLDYTPEQRNMAGELVKRIDPSAPSDWW